MTIYVQGRFCRRVTEPRPRFSIAHLTRRKIAGATLRLSDSARIDLLCLGHCQSSSLIVTAWRVLVQCAASRTSEQDHPAGFVASDLNNVAVKPVLVVSAEVASEVDRGDLAVTSHHDRCASTQVSTSRHLRSGPARKDDHVRSLRRLLVY
jgi:hypothetical protein